jgi:hypothetical protein
MFFRVTSPTRITVCSHNNDYKDYCSVIKMEAADLPETLLPIYQSIWSHKPKENTLQNIEGASNLKGGIADDEVCLILNRGYECV